MPDSSRRSFLQAALLLLMPEGFARAEEEQAAPLRMAAELLRRTLDSLPPGGPRDFTFGTISDATDRYEVAVLDGRIVVKGANPRAVLYGVFALQDAIAETGRISDDLRLSGAPSLRLRLLHPRARGNFRDYRQSDFEFLARCGGNVAHLVHDWMPEKTLFSFVASTAFPQAADPRKLEENRARLRQYLEWCGLYGLDGAMWLCEVPCQGGPWVPEAARQAFLERFPAECLSESGTYQGKLPCLAHPTVEQEYRRLVRQFLTDFPGVSMFLIFTGDSGGELCDPATCPRHLGVSKLTQYNRLLALMAEEGRKVRPDVQVFSIGWGWKFRGEPDYFTQQAALPDGAGLTLPPGGEAWSFDRETTDFLRQGRAVSREHGQPFLGYDILFWGDDTVFDPIKGARLPSAQSFTRYYDFPLGLAAKLRRWEALGADGFFDQWGTFAEGISCNAVALRELLFQPPKDTEAWARSLAARRFGAAAAPGVIAAWQEIEAAQQIQSEHVYYWHALRPAWSKAVLACPLTVEALQAAQPRSPEPAQSFDANTAANFHDEANRAAALAPALQAAADHFARALEHLQKTRPLVEPASKFDHWYEPEPGGPARLTPGQLLDEQIIAVRLQEQTQRRMSLFFEAYALVQALPAPGTPEHEAALQSLTKLREADEAATQPSN